MNRTFEGKEDGLLVAYAPLAENLAKALAEYTDADRDSRPIGRDVDEAVAIATELVFQIREMLAGCDWPTVLRSGADRAAFTATATNFLRDTAERSTSSSKTSGRPEALA